MKLYDKMSKAMQNGDADAFADTLHDDFAFVRHQTGETLDKDQMRDLTIRMQESQKFKVEDQRCLYENDDILVTHSKMSFPDGTREAVMSVAMKKDGKIARMETGATPIS